MNFKKSPCGILYLSDPKNVNHTFLDTGGLDPQGNDWQPWKTRWYLPRATNRHDNNETSRETRIPSSNFSAGLIVLLRANAAHRAMHRRTPGRWSALSGELPYFTCRGPSSFWISWRRKRCYGIAREIQRRIPQRAIES